MTNEEKQFFEAAGNVFKICRVEYVVIVRGLISESFGADEEHVFYDKAEAEDFAKFQSVAHVLVTRTRITHLRG